MLKYIVLDLEWNQAVAKELVIRKPFPLHGEIIQIGAIMLDENLTELDRFKVTVKPRYYLKMNSTVKRLTGIRSRDLNQGVPFRQAIEDFKNWCGSDCTLFTWGCDDAAMMLDNLRLCKLDGRWLPPIYNLQKIFSLQVTEDNRQWSLSGAMALLGIPQENQAHDALNDAVNTAAILARLDIGNGLSQYASALLDQNGGCLHSARFSGYTSRNAALADERLHLCTCPVCGRIMTGEGWQAQGLHRENSRFSCPEHGHFIARIRLKRTPNGYCAKASLYADDGRSDAPPPPQDELAISTNL